MAIQESFLAAAASLILKTIITLFASYCLLPVGASAQSLSCKPVAYLFRHAEEKNVIPANIDENTRAPEGSQHAALYPGMIKSFRDKLGYCPILRVFAMARKNSPKTVRDPNGVGTTNPFFTAKPLANAAELEVQCLFFNTNCTAYYEGEIPTTYDPITSTDLNVIEEPNVRQVNDILYEFLPYRETRDDLREMVKGAVESGWSVAFFWTSEGFNEVAEVLGDPVPAYVKDPNFKAPRNSVFVFSDWNPSELAEPGATAFGKFDTLSVGKNDRLKATGQFLQCFNYIPKKGFDTLFPGTDQIAYYCKYNEDLSEYRPRIPSEQLSRLKGAICDANKLKPYGDAHVYAGYGVADGNQCF